MKILRRLTKEIEVIAFVLGFVAGIYFLIFFPAKYFSWHTLPAPPEPALKIISANHMGDIIVGTASNKKLICNLSHEKECWTEINYEPLIFGKALCFMQNCPDNHTIQIVKVTGQMHSFGELSFTYSLHDNGTIYVKQSGFIYLAGYIMGIFVGGVCSLIAFIVKSLWLGINSSLQKDSIK
jgi:hypothetical protein